MSMESKRIYAIALERSSVDADFQPDQYANIWTAPETSSYTIALTNRSTKQQAVKLFLSTKSYDNRETTSQTKTVTLAANGSRYVTMSIALQR